MLDKNFSLASKGIIEIYDLPISVYKQTVFGYKLQFNHE